MSFNTYEQAETFTTLNFSAACLSFIGQTLIIFSYLAVPAVRSLSMKFVLALGFSELLFSISYILGYILGERYNVGAQEFLTVSSSISCMIWVLVILRAAYTQIKSSSSKTESLFRVGLFLNIVISVMAGFIGVIARGSNDDLFLVDNKDVTIITPLIETFGLLDVLRIVVGLVTLVYGFKISSILKTKFETKATIESQNMMGYCIILILTWIPQLSLKLQEAMFENELLTYEVHLICSVLYRLTGFFNLLLFAKTYLKKIRKYYSGSVGGSPKESISMMMPKELITL